MDKAIEWLQEEKLIEKLASRFASVLGGDKDDFVQHVWLIVLEMPREKLNDLYDKNQLGFYIISIARNQALGAKSTFNKTYKSPITVPLNENIDLIDED